MTGMVHAIFKSMLTLGNILESQSLIAFGGDTGVRSDGTAM